jgi:TonB family protein
MFGAVLAIHIGAIWWVARPGSKVSTASSIAQESITPISVLHSDKPSVEATAPIPEVHLVIPEFEGELPIDVVFGDPDWDAVPGVTGLVSSPQPVDVSEKEIREYSRRAGLVGGDSATVILGVEVHANGSVGEVSVIVSSGNIAADVAAADYVASLRWIPGSRNHHATEMKIRWPVTLVSR